MKFLPAIVHVKIQPPHHWVPGLWLPVFLLWPLIILLMVLMLLVSLVLILILRPRQTSQLIQSFKGLYNLICETRGTHVDIESGGGAKVFIAIR